MLVELIKQIFEFTLQLINEFISFLGISFGDFLMTDLSDCTVVVNILIVLLDVVEDTVVWEGFLIKNSFSSSVWFRHFSYRSKFHLILFELTLGPLRLKSWFILCLLLVNIQKRPGSITDRQSSRQQSLV